MKHGRVINLPKNPYSIMIDAMGRCFNHWVDEMGTLNNPSSFRREKSSLSFEEAFRLIQPYKPHWIIIFRQESYLTKNPEDDYWDFGGCNIANNGYGAVFIWIQVKPVEATQIFLKYNLEVEWY